MCAHTIYVAAKHYFAHKKIKKSFSTANNREILGLIGTRSKPKKKNVFAVSDWQFLFQFL